MRKVILATALVAVAIGSAAPAPAQDDIQARQIEALTKYIVEADNIRTAAAAYARANAIDPTNLTILNAYLRKALQLGRTEIALIPARRLVDLQPGNALAWGTLAYEAAKAGEQVKALRYAVQASAAAPDDAALAANVGQLLAWYDRQAFPPRLDNATLQAIAKVRAALADKAAFKAAYERTEGLYARQGEVNDDLRKELARLERQQDETQRQLLAIDAQLRDLNDEIDEQEELIDALRVDRYAMRFYTTRIPRVYSPTAGYSSSFLGGSSFNFRYGGDWGLIAGHLGSVSTGVPVLVGTGSDLFVSSYPAHRYRRNMLGRSIDRADNRIDSLENTERVLRAQGLALLKDYRTLSAEVVELRKKISSTDEAVQRRLAWATPAVDGVSTPENNRPIQGPAQKIEIPANPAAEAERHLKMARLYLRNGFREKAAEHLNAILDDYPDTPSADEAARLRASMID